MVEIIVLVTACLLNGMLGLVVLLKNPESTTNRLFFALTGSFIAWSIINYISLHPVLLSQLEWIRLVLFNAALLSLLVFLTFLSFPKSKLSKKENSTAWRATCFTVLIMALTLTPLVFKTLSTSEGHANPVPAPGIALFILQSVGLLSLGIRKIAKKFRRSFGIEKEQLRFILLGIAGTFTLIIATNFVLVVAFHNSSLVKYGPAYTLVFSFAFAYSIVRHKLFDIRLAVARSFAYVLIVGSMSLIYGAVLFLLEGVIFHSTHYQLLKQIIAVLLVTPIALGFQSIKQFFDRISNRIFFKESYDPQEVLDKIGTIVASEIELHKIVHGLERVLYGALKPSFVEFVLDKEDRLYFNSFPERALNKDMQQLGEAVQQQKQDLVIVDDLQTEHSLKEHFAKNNVALSLRLQANNQNVGYLLLGHRRGGDVYSGQDKKLLLIQAGETAVAVQNALRFEEIRNFNLTLQASIDEATKRLRHANQKLRDLDETKDDFISMASHQLRTPLTSFKGYVSMILDGDAGEINKTQREMLNQAFLSAQKMVFLISDMLNVSRLKTGKFTIENNPVNLAEIVEEEVKLLQDTAASRSLTLKYIKPEDFPELMLDETKIRQVIMNFTDNAIYYTPAGGQIDVLLADKGETVELRIKDNGIGVPFSERQHLFTKFYRAKNARTARPDGTGLGLFMAKKVIVAEGGALIFESQEGKGSTFGFMFSKAKLKVPERSNEPEAVTAKG